VRPSRPAGRRRTATRAWLPAPQTSRGPVRAAESGYRPEWREFGQPALDLGELQPGELRAARLLLINRSAHTLSVRLDADDAPFARCSYAGLQVRLRSAAASRGRAGACVARGVGCPGCSCTAPTAPQLEPSRPTPPSPAPLQSLPTGVPRVVDVAVRLAEEPGEVLGELRLWVSSARDRHASCTAVAVPIYGAQGPMLRGRAAESHNAAAARPPGLPVQARCTLPSCFVVPA
jgi:hypothetical protein